MAGQTAELGVAYISVVADTSKLTNGIKQALGGADKAAESQGQSLGSKLSSGIGKTLKVGAAGAGLAVGGILATSMAKGLGRLTAIENAQAKLKGLGNDAGSTAVIMKNALASVKGTSFGMGEAATTAAGAVAAGIKPGKELEGVLKSVANSAAASSKGMDEMGSIYNKVASLGKAQNDVLQQVADTGLPIYQALADQLGVTTDEVFKMASAGKIGFSEFEQAMTSAAGTVAEELGLVTQGTLENMGSAMGRFGEALQKPIFKAAPALFKSFTSVFDEMTDAVGPASERVGEKLTPALERVAEVVETHLGPAMGTAIEKLADLAVAFVDAAVDPALWERVGEIFGELRGTVERLWPSIESLGKSFFTIGQNISAATWQALASALNAIAPLIETVLVPLVERIAEFAEQNPDTVQAMVVAFLGFKALGAIAGPVSKASKAIGGFAGAAKSFPHAARTIGGAFSQYGLAGGFSHLGKMAKSANPVLGKLGGIIGKVSRLLGPIIKVLGTVVRFINPWVAAFTIAAGALTYFFTQTETGKKVWDWIVESFKKGIEWITDAFNGLKDLFTAGDFTGALREAFGWEEDHPIVKGILTVKDTIADVIKFIEGVYDLLFKGDYTGLPFGIEESSGVVQFFLDIHNAVKRAGEIIVDVFDWIVQAAKLTLGVLGTIILAPLIIAWNVLSWAIRSQWENVIKPAWEAMSNGAMWLWENGVLPVVNWISDKWEWLAGVISIAVGLIVLKFGEFKQNIFDLWTTYVNPILGWVSAKWDWVKTQISNAVIFIGLTIDAFKLAVSTLWSAYIQPILDWIAAKWDWLKNSLINAYNIIKSAVIDAFSAALTAFRDAVVNPILDAISSKWDWLKNQMHAGWVWIDSNVISAFRSGLEGFKSFFDGVVDGIGRTWETLRGKLAGPINFMIRTVYNEGIAEAWDTIAGMLDLEPRKAKRVNPIAGYAAGGQVQKDPTGAVRGPGTGTSDSILARIANGEHILTAREVAQAGGHDVIYAMRDMIKAGRPFSFDGRGGMVGLSKDLDLKAGDLAGAAPGLLLPGFKDGGEVRPLWETQLMRAHSWAAARHGRPYVFGGSAEGGGGTDCSGFMSGIADVIQGGNGARSWATMSFSGGGNSQMPSGPQGFVAGLGPGFSIGVTNGGAGGGHTAGTLSSAGNFSTVNVESGGSPSMVKYGVGADGADGSYFRTHYHLPIGADGAFVSGGAGGIDFFAAVKKWVGDKLTSILDPIKGLLPSGPPAWNDIPKGVYDKGTGAFKEFAAGTVENLGEKVSGVWQKITGLFDNGGWLMPGRMATNKSGKPEPILTAAQWSTVSKLLSTWPGAMESMTAASTAMVDVSATLDELNVSLSVWAAEMQPVVRKSAEDYAMEQSNSVLSPMGLEGAIPLAQKVGARVWDAYHAAPVEAASASPTVIEVDTTGGDFVHVDTFADAVDRIDGVEAKLDRKPLAATVTRGGAL